ncbi:MAG: EAL domain-containing protein, partial [Acidimicrobiales bacterium]
QSSSAERVFGYPPHQMVGRELRAWLHPEDADQLLRFLKSPFSQGDGAAGLARARMRHRDGSWRHMETSVTDMLHVPGVRGLVLNSRDVSDRVALELQLWERAWHDPLTGLANRSLFVERVASALIRRSDEGRPLAVVFLDLDDFKSVNDTLGHAGGDLLLTGVGDRLVGCIRPGDTVARLGGDEFALLLEDADSTTAANVAERVISELARPFCVSEHPVHARGSLGLVLADGTETVEDLLSGADTAMYVAKAHGKSRYELFKPQMRDRVVERSSLRTDLEWALQREELAIYYQPVVSVRTGTVAGFEALLRWNHPERGLLSPDEFIALAEESRLIVSIGAWVLRHACRQVSVWRQAHGHDFTMAVNVSTVQLQDAGLLGEIASALQESKLDPGALVLEITESSMMEDAEGMTGRLQELKELGVGLAIDDFGTGYSSLSYLRRLPVDQLKVDRSFVAGVATNPEDVAILASVINLSQILGISVVAEGVETMDQLEKLAEMGCDLAQGFNWLHPSDTPTVESWLHHVFGAVLPMSSSGDVRVLLADDRDGLRAMLRIALEIEDGFAVVAEAADTPETIRLAELHQPDLIVLDVAMPGTSGIAALPALRRVAPRATIVLLTALDPATVMANGGDAADGLIDKTRDLGEFLDRLSTLCIR